MNSMCVLFALGTSGSASLVRSTFEVTPRVTIIGSNDEMSVDLDEQRNLRLGKAIVSYNVQMLLEHGKLSCTVLRGCNISCT